MVLQLKDLFDRAGEKQSFEYDLDLSHLRHGAGHPLVKPVHIIGTVGKQNGHSYFRLPGHVYAKYAV